MDDLVTINLEVLGMKHAVMHAFAVHQSELQEVIASKLEKALSNWEIDLEVDRAIERHLKEEVGSIIAQQVARCLHEPEIRSALEAGVHASFTDALVARGLLKESE